MSRRFPPSCRRWVSWGIAAVLTTFMSLTPVASKAFAEPASDICTHVAVVVAAPAEGTVDVPLPRGRVTDTVGVLTSQCETALERHLADIEQRTGARLRVLVVLTTGSMPIERFAMRVFEKWQLGERNDAHDSILLLAAAHDRDAWIQVGNVRKAAISDLDARAIVVHQIVPAFRRGEFETGLSWAVDTLDARLSLPRSFRPWDNDFGDQRSLGFWYFLANVMVGLLASVFWPRWPALLTASFAAALLVVALGSLWSPIGGDWAGRMMLVFMMALACGPAASLLGWCVYAVFAFFVYGGIADVGAMTLGVLRRSLPARIGAVLLVAMVAGLFMLVPSFIMSPLKLAMLLGLLASGPALILVLIWSLIRYPTPRGPMHAHASRTESTSAEGSGSAQSLAGRPSGPGGIGQDRSESER